MNSFFQQIYKKKFVLEVGQIENFVENPIQIFKSMKKMLTNYAKRNCFLTEHKISENTFKYEEEYEKINSAFSLIVVANNKLISFLNENIAAFQKSEECMNDFNKEYSSFSVFFELPLENKFPPAFELCSQSFSFSRKKVETHVIIAQVL